MKPIMIVQGANWGSEAKGHIAGYLCKTRNVDYAVRTGATNAGHTVIYNGQSVKLQQLPVGFVNPKTQLVIGAGALIDPVILDREVRMLTELTGEDITKRLLIDHRAGLHLSEHADRSKASGRHVSMGATGKGCSEALIDRIKARGSAEPMLFGDWYSFKNGGAAPFFDTPQLRNLNIVDTELILNSAMDSGAQLLLEGTQGQLLDLYLGPYPYVTHKQTGPAQWMLECGLSPALPTEIVAVVRTMPIRVAGNSGPMPNETSWPIVARHWNYHRESYGLPPLVDNDAISTFEDMVAAVSKNFKIPAWSDGNSQHMWSDRKLYEVALSELNTAAWKALAPETQAELTKVFEMTTVTKKLRRIAHLDSMSMRDSARQMRPHWVALTFMNYATPQYWYELPPEGTLIDHTVINEVEYQMKAPVKLLTYGPADEHVLVR